MMKQSIRWTDRLLVNFPFEMGRTDSLHFKDLSSGRNIVVRMKDCLEQRKHLSRLAAGCKRSVQ